MLQRIIQLIFTILLTTASIFAAELHGRVVDQGGNPVASAVITISRQGHMATTVSDVDGGFSVAPDRLGGFPLTMRVRAANKAEATLTISDADEALEIVLHEQQIFGGEVKVTGTRAVAGETPVTLSNIGRQEIDRAYWGQDVPLILAQVPSFNAYNDNGNGIGYSYFTLRGFDMRRTAVSLNGVPLNGATSHGVFFIDLADFLQTTGDIQVQRGVGTSMYGNSALGGSVDIQTRAPLAEKRLRVNTNYGSWNTKRFSLEYDSGISDTGWAATFRYSRISTDGYRDQSWVEAWNYYAAVEHYGERSSTRIVLFGGPEDTHLAYDGISKPYLDGEITGDRYRDRRHNPLNYENEIDHFFQPHYQVHNHFRINENFDFDNTLFFFEGDGFFEQFKKGAWMPEYDLEAFPGPDGNVVEDTDLVRRRSVDEWDAGWIPSIEYRHGAGRGALQAGLAIRLHNSHHFGETIWAQYYPPTTAPNHPYYDYEVSKTTLQPFVQETWEFDEHWRLMAGLTWTSHSYEMRNDRRKGVAFEEDFRYLLPRFGVNYQPNADWSFFVNASRGAREPAFRDIYDPQDYWFAEPLDLDHEDLMDYEVGGRRFWENGFAALNLYWLDFDNAIVFAGGLDNNGVPVTANGAVVDQSGVEFEAAWMPFKRWGGQFALAYSHAEFDEFTEYDWDGNTIDRSGLALANSPEILANLQLIGGYGPADFMLTVRHVDEFYLDNSEDNRNNPEIRDEAGYVPVVNPSYTVANLACRIDLGNTAADLLSAEDVIFDLRINNLSDELYTTFGYNWPEPVFIPAATRSVYAGFTIDW